MIAFKERRGMDGLLQTAVIAGMFMLRIGVPLAITLGVAYALRRLDAKWQAEAWAELETSQPEDTVITQVKPLVNEQPCWSLKGCDETARAQCAAPQQLDIPCWLARRRSEGKLPAECYNCAEFSLRKIA
jgi:hypothetical protein